MANVEELETSPLIPRDESGVVVLGSQGQVARFIGRTFTDEARYDVEGASSVRGTPRYIVVIPLVTGVAIFILTFYLFFSFGFGFSDTNSALVGRITVAALGGVMSATAGMVISAAVTVLCSACFCDHR